MTTKFLGNLILKLWLEIEILALYNLLRFNVYSSPCKPWDRRWASSHRRRSPRDASCLPSFEQFQYYPQDSLPFVYDNVFWLHRRPSRPVWETKEQKSYKDDVLSSKSFHLDRGFVRSVLNSKGKKSHYAQVAEISTNLQYIHFLFRVIDRAFTNHRRDNMRWEISACKSTLDGLKIQESYEIDDRLKKTVYCGTTTHMRIDSLLLFQHRRRLLSFPWNP